MTDLSNQAIDDYLKTIYAICEREARASTGQIAEELRISPASVTGMLKKMANADPPLLQYRKHHGVMLTGEGELQALRIIRRHRLLECYLHDVLGYSWDEVHEEADRLEHAISPELSRKIAEVLQHPERDPHGSPIPTRDLTLAPDASVSLDSLEAGSYVLVQHVHDDDASLLRYLAEIGVVPGVELVIEPPTPFADHVRVRPQPEGETISVSKRAAEGVFVHEMDDLGTQAPAAPGDQEITTE